MTSKKSDLFYNNEFVWEKVDKQEKEAIFSFNKDYMDFLDSAKTERESIKQIVKRAEKEGFVPFSEVKELKAGTKFYSVNKGKMAALVVMGNEPLENGLNIVGSHVDAPRIDIKQNPLYEDGGLALLKTHYYGGIRKYQWVTLPLALYGTVIKKNGEQIDISIGDKEDEPVFYISDLLPHLAKDQNKKTLGEGIEGENLNVIIGSLPFDDKDEDDKFKRNILEILNEKYGIEEEDFISAELEMVPAGKSRDVGLDRGLIAAHGHDDRVCAYASLDAIFETKNNAKTAVALFVDKEEIGSVGNTGMHSQFFNNLVAELIAIQNGQSSELILRRALANSNVLSADVAAALDPTYSSVSEKQNCAVLGKGVTLVKYTGSRGKGGSNDANAEFVGKVRKLFNDNGIHWQTSELGKVDQGGGGTIAYILANYNMNVIDMGVPVLSMHAPVEVVSKIDVYASYKAYLAFFDHFN
ncbi:aminopeptidase [Sedimentibacter sp. zth1]|uniref:aminopeptidase n=1 Tax=Sedimentibacter sp. zth1 TaxID=2816908 RepID=UPI001A913A7B|nr:aminopeptidase [Sedimentibacter sp. zth1]QSX04899.1 aminopeptidase [Sedimentibacter sp. zth1]